MPVPRGYTYQIPTALVERVVPGSRVVVPVQRRQVVGVVVTIDTSAPDVLAKPIAAAPDAEPALSPALIELGRWISRYYGAPLGLALRALLPGALWSVRRPTGPAEQTERVVVLTQALPSLLERERAFRRAPMRRVGYEALEALGGSAPLRHLVTRLGLSRAVLDGLVQQRFARYTDVPRARDPFTGLSSPPPPMLTDAQRQLVAGIAATPVESPVLIHGVTGSGKTLVYLEVLRTVVALGKGAILLVPEIALTPQTVARVRGVFGDQVAVLHSGLSDGERADAWRALRRGERLVAVGPRSAVFAPVQRLAAIVVDEERVILGSATPSLETLHLARTGRVCTFELPERIGARPLPPVEVIDLRSAPRVAEARGIPWTEPLDHAVRSALSRAEQVILLLNRRGFATYLQCPACGDVRVCPHCAIALTVHQTPRALRCHYCGHEEPIPTACRLCGKETQRMRGLGTQQLEHFVGLRFPEARIARMDLDTTSTKWAHHRILERMAEGRLDILLGTQMIAKGLDFPNVTVVGVVDADTPSARFSSWRRWRAGRGAARRAAASSCRPGPRTTTPSVPPLPTPWTPSRLPSSRCARPRTLPTRRTWDWRASWRRTRTSGSPRRPPIGSRRGCAARTASGSAAHSACWVPHRARSCGSRGAGAGTCSSSRSRPGRSGAWCAPGDAAGERVRVARWSWTGIRCRCSELGRCVRRFSPGILCLRRGVRSACVRASGGPRG